MGKFVSPAKLEPFVRSTNKSGVKEKTIKEESEVVVLSDVMMMMMVWLVKM